ncbi:hypothetical protein FQN57_000725 [Myotisia sp. PD_48]|nr:hypothetical protein FQN57_000725 [Myotisia sp. PD_48]
MTTSFFNHHQSSSKSSVLKSIFPSSALRNPQNLPAGKTANNDSGSMAKHPHLAGGPPLSHQKHPLSERPLNSVTHDSGQSPLASNSNSGLARALHKRTKSSLSLKSLLKDKDKRESHGIDIAGSDGNIQRVKPKKTKSSTSLSSLFKRSQRSRGDNSSSSKDKENCSPPGIAENLSQSGAHIILNKFSEDKVDTRYAPETGRTLREEMSLYTPKDYSPSKQRNFYGHHQPTLAKRSDAKPRPKSDVISSSSASISSIFVSSRRYSPRAEPNGGIEGIGTHLQTKRKTSNGRRSSRVMAAIAAFGSKPTATPGDKQLDSREIEKAFEKLLDSRNIPANMREKMRSLDTNIKADFIIKDEREFVPSSKSSQKSIGISMQNRWHKNDSGKGIQLGALDRINPKSRPRSRTFTSKIDSLPLKKLKSGNISSPKRPLSIDLSPPNSSRGLQMSIAGLLQIAPNDASDPSDFVHYLKEVQKPEIVEVPKMHKLRILLRNETVAWVTEFMACGGMDELVQLLYRTIRVEWREEHEDVLMHEVLLCLKALCTTSSALDQLRSIESDFFPALLRMLFDEEKKGPSDFNTRGIIMSLLLNFLAAASPEEQHIRARRILSYMRDPMPPETAQPLSFIADIYQSRPFRIWCKEITNVTKEVFWMFLHHFNVVPVISAHNDDSSASSQTYSQRHFPPPHAPVPAAPYIGGVEWEATSYLAAHLDLMNGLIASMPTVEERNILREELKASGAEKVMGKSLRTCKEQFYPALHAGLRVWASAAAEDGWDHRFVREGPPRDTVFTSPSKLTGSNRSPKKRPGIVSDDPPRLDLNVVSSNNACGGGQGGDWL